MRKCGWLVVVAAVLAGAQAPGQGGTSLPPGQQATDSAAPEAKAEGSSLDLLHGVSQLMLVTLNGTTSPGRDDTRLLSHYTPGGVLLPPLMRPGDVRDYVASLRAVQSPLPLLIGTNLYDLPKGRTTPNAFFTQIPSLLSVAATHDPEVTAQLGRLIGRQLSAMGFNFNLGPSLELAPDLPGVRGTLSCLGSDPVFAAEAGGAMVKALLDAGIVAVPMGFPGGGANRMAKEPAVLVTPRALLERRELLPYRKAIELGAPIIHVGNTYVPTLEHGKVPASLSPVVMRDLLRKTLGFKGVIVAGPMDTNDVALAMDPSRAAIESLKAGADMILWNEAGSRVLKSVDDIVKAINEGALKKDEIEASLKRVVELKEKQGLMKRELPSAGEADKLERDKDGAEAVLAIERRSITLVYNRDGVLPLSKKASVPVGITGELGVEELYDALSKPLKYVTQQPIVSAKYSGRIMDFEINRLTSGGQGVKTAICIFADNGETATKTELVRALKEKGSKVVAVLLGYPSALPALTDADAVVTAYCEPTAYAATIRALADVLLGKAPVAAAAPEEIKVKVGEAGAFNTLHLVHSPAGILPVTVDEKFPAGMYTPYEPEASLKKALWDFGDGSKVKDFIAQHTYSKPGRYPITLTVTDNNGDSTTATAQAVAE
jgi:beta-N-acetylhexosaminidase